MRLNQSPVYADACLVNGAVGYGPVEAEVLYSYTIRHRPQRVVQIGAGVATAIFLAAAEAAEYRLDITCIDPFPTPHTQRLQEEGQINLLVSRVGSDFVVFG